MQRGGAKGNPAGVWQITLTAKELAAVVKTELLLKTSNLENIAGVIQEDLVNAFVTPRKRNMQVMWEVYTHNRSVVSRSSHNSSRNR